MLVTTSLKLAFEFMFLTLNKITLVKLCKHGYIISFNQPLIKALMSLMFKKHHILVSVKLTFLSFLLGEFLLSSTLAYISFIVIMKLFKSYSFSPLG